MRHPNEPLCRRDGIPCISLHPPHPWGPLPHPPPRHRPAEIIGKQDAAASAAAATAQALANLQTLQQQQLQAQQQLEQANRDKVEAIKVSRGGGVFGGPGCRGIEAVLGCEQCV